MSNTHVMLYDIDDGDKSFISWSPSEQQWEECTHEELDHNICPGTSRLSSTAAYNHLLSYFGLSDIQYPIDVLRKTSPVALSSISVNKAILTSTDLENRSYAYRTGDIVSLVIRDGLTLPVQILSPDHNLNSLVDDEVAEFQSLISNPHTSEHELQRFLESHPAFLPDGYSDIYPQVLLQGSDGCKLKPDFILKPFGSDLLDILEIKPASYPLYSGPKRRIRPSHQLAKAISQAYEYLAWLNNSTNKNRIQETLNLKAIAPKAFIYIGRSCSQSEAIAMRQLTQNPLFPQTQTIIVQTYDDVLVKVRKSMVTVHK